MLTILLALPIRGSAQDALLVRAREAATSGHRAEALTMLEARLADTPRDVDARLLYGLVLSWEGRYDDARPVLRQVLEQAPGYTDARAALMNVEYWSGHAKEALELADRILASQPGHVTARAIRERLLATTRPWWATSSYTLDAFNDDTDPWHEVTVYVTRKTPAGSVIGRVSHAARFGFQDQQYEIDFYPRFRPGTYAYLNAGVAAPRPDLYPRARFAFDLYQSLGGGFEASGGARYLDFGPLTRIYVGTLTKYVGNWMVTGKVYHVPASGDLDSTSYQGGLRRYFGGDGTSYVGANYSHGFSHEEIRTIADLGTVDSETIRGETDVLIGTRLRLFANGGTSRQERANRSALWQTTITTGLSVQF